jgi:hypothetical protein
MAMIDIETIQIQGDISRADARTLFELCSGKSVVEVGVGGSTLLLARCAASLTSFDVSSDWIAKTQRRIDRLSVKTCSPLLVHCLNVPDTIEPCDVLFVDGLVEQRGRWVARHFQSAWITICHDSRGTTDGRPTSGDMLREALLSQAVVARLHDISFHHRDSNMLVLRRRPEPAEYVNWNLVEKEGRLNPHGDDE